MAAAAEARNKVQHTEKELEAVKRQLADAEATKTRNTESQARVKQMNDELRALAPRKHAEDTNNGILRAEVMKLRRQLDSIRLVSSQVA